MNSSPWLSSQVAPAICPKCNAPALRRSHAQTRFEERRKHVTGKRPYRCHVCGWRGWFDETELRFPTSAQKPLPPQVAGRDVPIPDIKLDDACGRMARYPSAGGGGRESGAEDAALQEPLADGESQQPRGELADQEFFVFGMPVTSQARNAKDSADADRNARESVHPPAATARRRVAFAHRDPLRHGGAETDGAAGVEKKSESAAGRKENEPAETTDLLPTFDGDTGRPVSDKVSPAFHHHARNKSWACPKCREFTLYRSRARSIIETLKKQFTRKRPYRCHRCGWRGWLTE